LAARRHSVLYGLAAMLMSLGLGYAAAWAFARRS
jgi:ABC-type spermidine/putrescine transport system permease subunit I